MIKEVQFKLMIYMEIEKQISEILNAKIKELTNLEIDVQVSVSSDLTKGDLTSNIALRLGGKLGSPMEAGEKIIEKLHEESQLLKNFKKIEVASPGFINFWYSEDAIDAQIDLLMHLDRVKENGQKIIFEFGDPNPFKEPHIGHLRNLVLGESIVRLLESQGNKVIRANYQGDVGMHVAKAIYGLLKVESLNEGSLGDQVKVLAEAYKYGAKAYEEEEKAKEEIISINNKIYIKDSEIMNIWEKGRKISLDYFEELYKKLDIKYEKYYFESEIAEKGKEIVETHPDVFPLDDGARIFKGEDEGLHNRVFINSHGNPTYEAKDLGLAFLKNENFPDTDKSIIMTANEQIDYFRVLLKALKKTDEKIAEKTTHLSFGFVNLKDGKMSSRTGNVVGANWLIGEVKNRLKDGFKEVSDEVLDDLATGAVKWSMLKFSRESDIAFSIDESVDLTGHSGPYMQYTFARISSLILKSENRDFEANSVKNLEDDLIALIRFVCQFESAVKMANDTFSPNILTEYLFKLAQNFNTFYEKEKIIGTENEKEKLAVCMIVKSVIGQGMHLLGISTPEKI